MSEETKAKVDVEIETKGTEQAEREAQKLQATVNKTIQLTYQIVSIWRQMGFGEEYAEVAAKMLHIVMLAQSMSTALIALRASAGDPLALALAATTGVNIGLTLMSELDMGGRGRRA